MSRLRPEIGPPTADARPGRVGFPLLLLVAAIPFLVRPELIGGDEPHYAAMASSMAFDGDLDVRDEYAAVASGTSSAAGRRFVGLELDPHLIEKPAGLVFSHSLGLPALAAPVLRLAAWLGLAGAPDYALGLLTIVVGALGLREAVLLLGRWLRSERAGAAVALAIWLGTPLWFYQRTFFTEPYLAAFLTGACGLLARGRPALAGALLGAAFLIKESAALPAAVVLAGALWLCGGRAAVRAALGAAFALPLFVARNLVVYGDGPVDFPQPFRAGDPGAGALGLLVDPAHGLLAFAPVALVAAWGWWLARENLDRRLALLSAAAFVGYFALCATWTDWRGGACFGPRLLVPVLPALAVPVGLVWKRCGGRRGGWRVVLAAAAVGAGIEVGAIASPFRSFWSLPVGSVLARSAGAAAVALLGAAAVAVWLLSASERESG